MNNLKIKKCLKSYLSGKKYYESDIDKSFDYFKQCLFLVENIKSDNIELDDDLNEILNDTEIECSKYLSNTIEKSLLSIEDNDYKNNSDITLNLFNLIETGDFNPLKNLKYNELNFNMLNEFGLTPLHYAVKYGDTSFLKLAFKLGEKIDQTNLYGHTLLEYACLEKDPNMIKFLLLHGANMKKHLIVRQEKKYINNGNQIDFTILEIFIMNTKIKYEKLKYLDWIFQFLNENDKLVIKYNNNTNITIDDFILKLDNLLDLLNEDYIINFIDILKDELMYNFKNRLGCSNNKIEIILYNLCSFINYEHNLNIDWLINQEIKYNILNILKYNYKINLKYLKLEIYKILKEKYFNTNLLTNEIINIYILQWINKLKV